jgi:hypothetical protein
MEIGMDYYFLKKWFSNLNKGEIQTVFNACPTPSSHVYLFAQ